MALQLVYGRSGTGKSEYCFKQVKNLISMEKIYIVTPEQFSFNAEKKLLDTLETNSVINAEVLSFNRMAQRVLKELNNKEPHLSKCGKAMLIYNILSKNKFKFLTKPETNIQIATNTINELKKHNIEVEKIPNIKTNDMYLKTKLEDIYLLYKVYQESIQSKYIDENDILTLLADNIDKTQIFNNSIIYIDEFVGFTPQEYEIIKKLFIIAKKVVITIPAEVEESTNLNDVSLDDIFYESKKTAAKLIKCAKETATEIEKPIILNETYRFKSKELKHLEKNIYATSYKKYEEKTENINIFLAANPYSEVEHMAQSIISLVKSGYKYNDIAIITKNLDTYSSITKAIFSKYGIPIFIDEKKELNQNTLAKYILSIFELISNNWKHDSVFNYLKNSFCGIDIDIVHKLENYCTKFGIKNNKWLVKWEDDMLEPIRQGIVDNIVKLKEDIYNAKTFKNITVALYNFLERDNIKEKLNKKIEVLKELDELELVNEYISSYSVITTVLNEIVTMFGEENTTIEKYRGVLKVGLENIHIGEIPARIDQVIIGDVSRSKAHKVKVIYIIGLNDGVFPSQNNDEGFLDDTDRNYLKENGIELASGTLEQIYEEQLNIYKAFTTSENKLFLSYASSNKEGKALRQSVLISKIKKIFPKIDIYSDIVEKQSNITVQSSTFDELLLNLRRAQDGVKIDSIWYDVYNWYKESNLWKDKLEKAMKGIEYTNLPEKINIDNIKKLYGSTLHTTISRLEQYRKCPFSFHLKYGLKLEDKKELQLKSIDTGSFMHNVIENFFDIAKDVKNMNEQEIRYNVNRIIDKELALPKNYIFNSTAKFRLLTNRLKKVVLQSIIYIIEQLRNSDFNILDNEVEFKNGAKYKPIVIDLDNGKKVEITGKIDRIDIATSGGNNYIRIIDYKSSVKDIDLNEVINGLQIQLLTYLDSVTEIENMLPAGVLYFSLIDPIIKNNKGLTDEEIKQKIKEQFRMRGLILADINIIKMMDNRLQAGKSDIIPVAIKKDGEISSKNTIKQNDFVNLQKQVKRVIAEISKEILEGKIDIKPYKGKDEACKYCTYKPICAFNTSMKGNDYFKIKQLENEEILEQFYKE